MKELQLILERENKKYASNELYILLGHFGDKMPIEIKGYIRNKAETLYKNAEKIDNKLKK